jgi:membrane-associated phospholipid phosphatase
MLPVRRSSVSSAPSAVFFIHSANQPRSTLRDAEHFSHGDFLEGGNSFPSGHSMAIWSVATVVALEYRRHRWVQFTAYGIATLVNVSRFTGSNPFLSDVLIGSATGYGTARYVYQAHHDPMLNP